MARISEKLSFRIFLLEGEETHPEQQQLVDEFLQRFYQKFPELMKFKAPVVYSPKDGTKEAECQSRRIVIYENFFTYDPMHQIWMFAHEMGHWALDKTIGFHKLSQILDIWNDLPYNQNNGHEAFADCFAEYLTAPGQVQARYPEWAKAVEMVLMDARRMTHSF